MISEKVIFDKLVMTADFKRIPKHFAENEACFLFLSKGAFQFRTPTNVITFSEGEGMLAKCGNYFFEELVLKNNPEENKIVAISAYFYPEIIKQIFTIDIDFQKVDNSFDVNNVSGEPLLKSFMDSIDYLLDNPKIADDTLLLLKIKELILLISRTNQAEKLNDFIQSLFSKSEYDFKNIIESNLYTNMKLEELAFLSNSSLATFKRKFVDHYKESPAKYIATKKLEKASQLLQIKAIPISEIAYDCGFETIPNFNKAFKNYFSKSPSEFRLS